ncbi:hypothetical protein ACHHYP_14439 [Achlya hypogyna]|uniref:Helicase-associated domain-containing protein n=1 Tax=Achlya hypogyna TaxID=1202772 RepID=A0A1V9YD58_ACHHY|nr:hypothetical protein ACHHYP_14439 [Achlya hypogyna]
MPTTPKRKRQDETRRFETFVEAATLYHDMHRATATFTSFPKFFTIPSEAPWPAHLHGVKLNTAQVRTHYKCGTLHPDTIARLQAINFVFDVNELKWELKLVALQTYKALHGDLCIPQDFRIPSQDPAWPRDLWGMRLGLAVRSIRQKTDVMSPRYAQLSAMGFVWNVLELSWDTKVVALTTYKALFGDLLVAYNFKVPSEHCAWPVETWGLKLGHAVHNIRQNADDMAADRRATLEQLGFVWDFLELSWEAKVTALRTYKRLYDTLHVPYGFIVPRSDPWPKETWGMKLGHAVHNIRQNTKELSSTRKMQLNDLGFVWHSVSLSWDVKLATLESFHRLYGHLNIPAGYRVPKDDAAWPKKASHVRLTDVADDLRRNRAQLTHAQCRALEALAFQWHDDDGACDSDGNIESVSICEGFPLLKRLRHLHVGAA